MTDSRLNPVCWLQGIRHRAYPVLLDSGQPTSPSGRYSIIAAEPRTVWAAEGPDTLCCFRRQDDGGYQAQRQTGINVLQALTQLTSDCPLPAVENPGFNGGLIGLLPYDLGAHAYGVNNAPRPDSDEFAHSAACWGWVGDYDRAVVIDHQSGTVEQIGASGAWQPATAEPHALPLADRGDMQTSLDHAGYGAGLQRIRNYLRAGDVYQVNLTRRFHADWLFDPVTTYCTLRRATPMPFSGYLDMGSQQLLSMSPERFLRVVEGQMETRPIKGTRPRGKTPDEDVALRADLLSSDKDRAENLMIVDLLRNDLGQTAVTGSVSVPQLFEVESYANVHQLVSAVTATLDSRFTPLQALLKAFPGGSITGAPKKRAVEIIAELEPHRRGPYCGTLFYQDVTGRLDSNILIRSALIDAGTLSLWSGGGIVWDSDPEAEYQETHDKISGLANALGLALP